MRAPSISALIKDELVHRFEALTKEEVRQHKLAIEKTELKINKLQKSYDELLYVYEGLKSNLSTIREELKNDYQKERLKLSDEFDSQRIVIKDNDKSIKELICSVVEIMQSVVTHEELESVVRNIIQTISQNRTDTHKEIENQSLLNKKIIDELEKHLEFLNNKIHDDVKTVSKSLDVYSRDLSQNKVDAAGVIREILVYKKSMFILEKKVEHLFTELETIQSKGTR